MLEKKVLLIIFQIYFGDHIDMYFLKGFFTKCEWFYFNFFVFCFTFIVFYPLFLLGKGIISIYNSDVFKL